MAGTQNESSIDMNTRGVQSGHSSGQGGAMGKIEKLPEKALNASTGVTKNVAVSGLSNLLKGVRLPRIPGIPL